MASPLWWSETMKQSLSSDKSLSSHFPAFSLSLRTSQQGAMLRLKCAAQTYAWGRPAAESEVIVKGERRRTVDRRCNASFPPSFHQGTRGAMDASPARIGPFFGRALRLPFPREQREISHEGSWCLSIGAQRGPRRFSAAPWNGRAERKKKEGDSAQSRGSQPRFQNLVRPYLTSNQEK